MGYYPIVEVAPGSLILELPSYLNEVEMAVCLEMLICHNIPYTAEIPTVSHAPVVTLKRSVVFCLNCAQQGSLTHRRTAEHS